jgi:hypothetical protein
MQRSRRRASRVGKKIQEPFNGKHDSGKPEYVSYVFG